MGVRTKFVVYELNRVMGSEQHLALEEVNLNSYGDEDWQPNSFESEEHAITALVKSKKRYETYIILKQVYIS